MTDNYTSLADESWGEKRGSWIFVGALFILFPLSLGFFAGYHIPIWTGFIGALISVIGVLTGFSINSIVLLTGHSEENSYALKTRVVEQTKDYTLYSILVGISLLVILVVGFLLAKAGPGFRVTISGITLSDLQVISGIVYSVLAHYVLLLFVITHRLYTLVHGNALGNA